MVLEEDDEDARDSEVPRLRPWKDVPAASTAEPAPLPTPLPAPLPAPAGSAVCNQERSGAASATWPLDETDGVCCKGRCVPCEGEPTLKEPMLPTLG